MISKKLQSYNDKPDINKMAEKLEPSDESGTDAKKRYFGRFCGKYFERSGSKSQKKSHKV